ncbi:flagellar basal-body P-ring protein [Candidatus Scalindua japonica]|uniref:Flagellar P-ring protein n=1 Tax=Candidatus Scalindua japonica TaxID=1284222 RepID=A0A286TV68_9BACT|nr:flagellar basal body P-ring protein FlgI [Candidatus Scalindua japonica]GAX59810.1 flagellar basal-body P-ring protein [Candidatus Scalindua japonica]
MLRYIFYTLILTATCTFSAITSAHGSITTRIKDIASVQGVRDNYLFGYGLVIGLMGSGDKIDFTKQLAKNVFEKLGVILTTTDFSSKNIAGVLVTANIRPFAKPGDRMDVLVSSIGDAKSLEGGVLVHTTLQGIDNEVYAVAQGPISLGGGFNVGGKAGDKRKNIATTGNVPQGAMVEKEIPVHLFHENTIKLSLKDTDFTTATRLMNVINVIYPNSAQAVSAAEVEIKPPPEFRNMERITQFISKIEELPITPDTLARVVINERTGTIVAGENVKISTVAVAHGSLTITISENTEASQPGAFAPSSAETKELDRTTIDVEEEEAKLHIIPDGVSISEIARALNVLGVTPRDLMAIFQAIHKAGALHAELIIM